jgi:hypothetical protein
VKCRSSPLFHIDGECGRTRSLTRQSGFQDAEVADGTPVMLNETAPVKPEVAVTVTV